LYFTNDLGKKTPSAIISPDLPVYGTASFTKEQMIIFAEMNIPRYSRVSGGEGFIPTSPEEPVIENP
jgi:hypothetical protein